MFKKAIFLITIQSEGMNDKIFKKVYPNLVKSLCLLQYFKKFYNNNQIFTKLNGVEIILAIPNDDFAQYSINFVIFHFFVFTVFKIWDRKYESNGER